MAGRGGACYPSRERGPGHRDTRDGANGTTARAAKANGPLITSAGTGRARARRPGQAERCILPIRSRHPAPLAQLSPPL
jgi:hypothetical protein